MKVQVLARPNDVYLRQTKKDLHKVQRNFDPKEHPYDALREYTKALNAVKLERVFAKPFIGNLEGHQDVVSCIESNPKHLSHLISGCYDGEIRVWNLTNRTCINSFQAHDACVRDITFAPDGLNYISISDDKNIKFWTNHSLDFSNNEPTHSILSKSMVMSISHHIREPKFVTGGEKCHLWEQTRDEPIKTFDWGVNTIHQVAFSPTQFNIFASCASDRSIMLHDTRDFGDLHKVTFQMRVNKLCWNPYEPFVFTCANEDFNSYSYDMRNLRKPLTVHMDHTSAVIDIKYNPTGKEFVTGSYDKTLRIFDSHKSKSKDIYHTKRMQRITHVSWTLDQKYIISASDEMNIRIWKAKASEKLGVTKSREREALLYADTLKNKFASHPNIRRIARHRQLPKHVYNTRNELNTIKLKNRRKEANRRAHSKPGSVPFLTEREKHIVREEI